MTDTNLVILTGRIVKDIELKKTNSGKSYAKATLAVSKSMKDNQGKWNNTAIFIDCVLWNTNAEYASRYLLKGSRVIVKGSISINEYKNGNGANIKQSQVLVEQINSLETKAKLNTETETKDTYEILEESNKSNAIDSVDMEDDDKLPF